MRRAAALLVTTLVAACASDTAQQIGGETHWINVDEGRLKAQVFRGASVGERPILVLVLHGDLPNPRPDYQYLFAKIVAQGLPSEEETPQELRPALSRLRSALGPDWGNEQVIAGGILRPGYTDPSGDRSSGDVGMAIGDNYTPEVVDAVANAARSLEAAYDASAVVLVGHSGGGAIVANVLGRHPDVADAALLVACGCDPEAWRARMRALGPDPIWDEPNPSLMPLSLVDRVDAGTHVRMLVGQQDDVAPPQDSRRYAEALAGRGIDVELTVVPELGHNILMTPDSFRELDALVRGLAR